MNGGTLVMFAALAAMTAASAHGAANCDGDSTGLVPLNDLGVGAYMGSQGGLYPGGSNERPAAHDAAGRALGAAIVPLGPTGAPSASGRIVLLTIGMSNTSQESNAFRAAYQVFANRNPRVLIVNAAMGGVTADEAADPANPYWTFVASALANAGATPAQVQALWLKTALSGPGQMFPPGASFPDHPALLRDLTGDIVRNAHDLFPRLRQGYLSSRTYAGYAGSSLNPEPYAYEAGFSVKWLIESQINGDPALNFDGVGGAAEAPWLSWGAYLWADGLMARSDGLVWECSDFSPNDGTHPSEQGRAKVADLLVARFASDPASRRWFVGRLADLNNDGVVNFADLNLVLGDYGASGGAPAGDVDLDGDVDFADLNAVLNLYGT